jgi:OOP family OmpA-OmpF porin
MIRKTIGVAVFFAAMIMQAGAQGFGIELNGGLQGTRFPLENGQTKALPGTSLGLGYSFRLGNKWVLRTGVTGGLYRTKASLQDSIVFTSYQVDDAGSAFQYTMKAKGYKETQQFFAASVPLLLQYHTAGEGAQWYFEGGGKVFVPFNTSIDVSAEKLILSGYYPDFNVDVSNLPQHGFGTVNGWTASANTKLKPAAALCAATGVSFGVSPGTRLYAGVYIDYGLTDLKKKNDSMPFATYNPTGITGVHASSVLNMQNAGKVSLLSFGLQLRLSFGSARAKPDRTHTEKEPRNPADSVISDDDLELMERPVVFGLIGETALPETEKPHLDDVADIMKEYPTIRISIVGHICNSETETENKKVAAARAKAVAQYLRSKGIDRSRMDVSSISQSDEVQPNNPPANYRARRVVITVQ